MIVLERRKREHVEESLDKFHRSGQPGQTDYRFTVYPSRIRLALLALGALVFVLAGAFMCYTALADRTSSQPPVAIFAVGVLAVVFFGCCLLYGVVRLVLPKPAVVLDNTGLYDHASATSVGHLAWPDITDVATLSFGAQRMLSIRLTDPESVLSRASGLRRLALRTNVKLMGTPVNIPQTMLPIPVKQLEAEIRRSLGNTPVEF